MFLLLLVCVHNIILVDLRRCERPFANKKRLLALPLYYGWLPVCVCVNVFNINNTTVNWGGTYLINVCKCSIYRYILSIIIYVLTTHFVTQNTTPSICVWYGKASGSLLVLIFRVAYLYLSLYHYVIV